MALCCATVIFAVVFSLYEMPAEPLLYSLSLSLFICLLIGIVRYTGYYRRHRQLQVMKKTILISLDGLPDGVQSQLEADYRELLSILSDSRTEQMSIRDAMFSDMNDYYTIWAHQIKTPIAAMRLLLQRDETEEQEELTLQLFRIEQYVDMVLGYIRTEKVSSDLVICPCMLDEIIKQSIIKFSRQFIKKRLSLVFEPAGLIVLTDEKWLSFVIEQLISNSLKYTATGSITITCIQTDGMVEVSITDTGIGIRAEDLPRLGEKGFTGYNGHEDKRSTGIGLYLCKKILHILSCQMQITSTPGKGTTVHINGLLTEDAKLTKL